MGNGKAVVMARVTPFVVRLRKEKGKTIQDCDVYIGNAVFNSNWSLEESKWCDPFHQEWSLSVAERKKKYRDYITSTPRLMQCLHELKGKTLGCLCQNSRACHGHVLVDLVTTMYKEDKHRITMGDVYYFKGSFSPLSNFYPSPLQDPSAEGGNDKRRFKLGSFQMYVWTKAVNAGQEKMANAVLRAPTIKKVRQLSYRVKDTEMSVEDQILSMYKIQKTKYDQVPMLRAALDRLRTSKRVPAEATENSFWACGVDIEAVRRSTTTELCKKLVTGKNYIGWILALIHAERTNSFYWLDLMYTLPPSIVEGFSEVRGILAAKKLTKCPVHFETPQDEFDEGTPDAFTDTHPGAGRPSGGERGSDDCGSAPVLPAAQPRATGSDDIADCGEQ